MPAGFSSAYSFSKKCLSACGLTGFTAWSLFLMNGGPLFAEAPSDPFEEFRIRIEKLERENRELKDAVGSRTTPASFSTDIPPAPAADDYADPNDPAGGVPETEEDKRIRSIVERYMRRSRQDSVSDASQDSKISTLDSELDKLKKRLDKAASGTWNNDGLTFTSSDGNYKTHMGGVAQIDWVSFPYNGGLGVPGGAGTQQSVEFRRLRFRAEGTMHHNIDWVSEFDFALALQNVDPTSGALQNLGLRSVTAPGAGNTAGPGFTPGPGTQAGNTINVIQPTTVFITIKEVPFFANVRLGNQQDWLSLEHIVSARFQDFMERSPVMDAFSGANNNGYAPGVSFFNTTENKMASWQFGAYNNNVYNSGFTYNVGNQWMYGGRATWSPIYECDGRHVVHTGFGAQYRQFNTEVTSATGFDNIRIRSRGVLRNTASTLDPNYADTGNFFVTGQTILNPELAIVWDRWFFQSEISQNFFYGARAAKGATGVNDFGTLSMTGGYVEALYFLTDEYKEYNRNNGTFGRVVPHDKLDFKKETYGGWQVGGRFDWLDLNSKLVQGGISNNYTIGLNWYLNANARIQFNYVISDVSNSGTYAAGPNGSLVGARFQGDGIIQSVGTRLDFNF